jgi:hypothetical protein
MAKSLIIKDTNLSYQRTTKHGETEMHTKQQIINLQLQSQKFNEQNSNIHGRYWRVL